MGDKPDPRDVLLAAALRDEDVRRALKEDPRGTIKRVLGIEVPPGVEVEVLEEQPGKLYLVLPAASNELTDEELDEVVAASAGFNSLRLAPTRISRIAAAGPWMTDVISVPSPRG